MQSRGFLGTAARGGSCHAPARSAGVEPDGHRLLGMVVEGVVFIDGVMKEAAG